jgi:hypothetical protein
LIAASSTSGLAATYSTPAASSICRRMALVEARMRAKRTTLWKRSERQLARGWGQAQPAILAGLPSGHSKIHPRGRIQSPACESRVEIRPTRDLPEGRPAASLLAIPESLPKPRTPAPNYNINLLLNIYKGRIEVGFQAR